MSYWDLLPSSLKIYIYEFDISYKEPYNILMKELIYRTSYWRLKFLHPNNDNNNNKFESRKENIQYLIDYWNNSYPDYYNLLPKDNKYNTEEEFLTDNHSNKYHIIFRDLKMLKTYNFIFNDHEVRLIRKHYANPKTLALTKRSENQHQCNTTT